MYQTEIEVGAGVLLRTSRTNETRQELDADISPHDDLSHTLYVHIMVGLDSPEGTGEFELRGLRPNFSARV